MYFLGSENYIVLTFWDQSDKKDHIYLINWDCNTSGKVSITLCCRSDLPLADVEIDNKYVKKLPGYYEHVADILVQKKIGDIEAIKAEYIMTSRHNDLSNEMVKFLKRKGYTDVVTDKEFVDIQAIDPQGKKIYFELKTADTVKLSIFVVV